MKKLLYITVSDRSELGVAKKINAQSIAFERKGYSVTKTYFDGDNYCVGSKAVKKINRNFFYKVWTRFFFPEFIFDTYNKYPWDVIYIRKPTISPGFVKFLSNIDRANCKIILEIPTYPYDKEFSSGLNKFAFVLEKIFRRKLVGKIDLITYFGTGGDEIWKLPALELYNGIDLNNININQPRKLKNVIRFVAVGKLAQWHGYDRFIKCLAKAPLHIKENIIFDVVGDGSELNNLKKLASTLNISDMVNFHGSKNGSELDNILGNADVGVGCLATFRKGLISVTSLKLREYCARGIPFIYSEHDPQFENSDFKYKVSHDEQDFDIVDIVDWYENLNISCDTIRAYADENLSWDIQIERIFNKLNNI